MRILPLGFLALLATAAAAATLTVDPAGEGDFTTIQGAVDAAEPGDTVLLAPGFYRTFATIDLDGTPTDVYVDVTTDDLTLSGAGAGQTVIGPESPDIHGPGTVIGILGRGIQTLRVQQLEMRGLVGRAVAVDGGALAVAACTFADCGYGIYGTFPSGGDIAACFFANCQIGVQAAGETAGLTVRAATFDGCGSALRFVGPEVSAVQVRDCNVMRGDHGAMLLSGATGEFVRCLFEDQGLRGIYVGGAGSVHLESCTLREPTAVGIGLIGADAGLSGRNTVVESGVTCVHLGSSAAVDFRQSHLLRTSADAWSVRTDDSVPGPQRHADLTENWWGTTDTAEIATWIFDGVDDPGIAVIVDTAPAAGGEVSADGTTWSDLKARFR